MSKPPGSARFRSLAFTALIGLSAVIVLSAAAQHLFIVDFKQDGVGVVEHLAGASGVALSSDGRFVFTSAEADDALTIFEREPFYGSSTFDQVFVDDEDGVFNMMGASAVASAPDGRHVYVTSAFDNSLLVFAHDASTDSLVFVASQAQEDMVGGVYGLSQPTAVAVSGDDEQVFVAAEISDSVAVFSRDATNDTLTFVDAQLDGVATDHLAGASGVAISPDHRHVYVTSSIDDALTVFSRGGGFISPVTAYVDGVDGIDGLDGASGVAVSPDGQHVYAVAGVDNTLTTFARDPISGTLTLIDLDRDGVDGVDGLGGARAVAVSPLGNRVFVASQNDNGVALFRRMASTGQVDLLDVKTPAVGLRGAGSLAVSPDGIFVYAACYDDDSMTGIYVALCEGDEATGDSDDDAFCDDEDLCTGDDLTGDTDVDTICDDQDICPGFDDTQDADADTVPDGCDQCEGDDATGDDDNDSVCNDSDVCPGSDDNQDADGDNVPNGCDVCLGNDATGDSDTDQVCDDLDACPGSDDGIDTDNDNVPDGCDQCEGDDATGDSDGDSVCDDLDICAGSDDGIDTDGDQVPDGCDLCEGDDATGDADNDGVCADNDCDPGDPDASVIDLCGVCGGDNSSCSLFIDGFESADTAAWSSAVP